jgi:hypothetical protein
MLQVIGQLVHGNWYLSAEVQQLAEFNTFVEVGNSYLALKSIESEHDIL